MRVFTAVLCAFWIGLGGASARAQIPEEFERMTDSELIEYINSFGAGETQDPDAQEDGPDAILERFLRDRSELDEEWEIGAESGEAKLSVEVFKAPALGMPVNKEFSIVSQGGQILMVNAVSTGERGFETPSTKTPEHFWTVKFAHRFHYSSKYNQAPMHWAMFFNGGIALHATQPSNYGLLGQPASHGCVRHSGPDIQDLFNHVVGRVGARNVEIKVYRPGSTMGGASLNRMDRSLILKILATDLAMAAELKKSWIASGKPANVGGLGSGRRDGSRAESRPPGYESYQPISQLPPGPP